MLINSIQIVRPEYLFLASRHIDDNTVMCVKHINMVYLNSSICYVLDSVALFRLFPYIGLYVIDVFHQHLCRTLGGVVLINAQTSFMISPCNDTHSNPKTRPETVVHVCDRQFHRI
jgi:hypothetical protein